MAAPAEVGFSEIPPPAQDTDQLVVLYGVEWKTYCALRELFDSPGVRMTYLKGALEIMSPSRRHEGYKTRIARLVELFALETDVRMFGYGSTTFKKPLAERGLEPNECYVVDRDLTDDDFPDIALEVVITSGGINKLHVYRGLGVREVWIWSNGAFHIHVLGLDGYTEQERSSLVPTLDFTELAALADDPDQHAALKRFQQRLRKH